MIEGEPEYRYPIWSIDLDSPSLANPACPWLPEISTVHDFSLTRRHGASKGAEYYLDALRYAQSLWCAGKPAQAILQLNKAWMADLAGDTTVLESHPPPYRALVWILQTASAGGHGYLGNPVRHFQHLASRMCGPRSEIRSWRAWLCFHLAEKTIDVARFPRDAEQLAREGLWIPGVGRALHEVARKGWKNETKVPAGCLCQGFLEYQTEGGSEFAGHRAELPKPFQRSPR